MKRPPRKVKGDNIHIRLDLTSRQKLLLLSLVLGAEDKQTNYIGRQAARTLNHKIQYAMKEAIEKGELDLEL